MVNQNTWMEMYWKPYEIVGEPMRVSQLLLEVRSSR